MGKPSARFDELKLIFNDTEFQYLAFEVALVKSVRQLPDLRKLQADILSLEAQLAGDKNEVWFQGFNHE